jgi:hypothetical protein
MSEIRQPAALGARRRTEARPAGRGPGMTSALCSWRVVKLSGMGGRGRRTEIREQKIGCRRLVPALPPSDL